MLNREGWSLLMILCLLIVELMLALPRMGRERTVGQRLACEGKSFGTGLAVALRCAGALGLAVLPGMVAQGGLVRALPAAGLAASLGAMLLWVVPKVRRLSPDALTLPEALSEEKSARGVAAALCVLSALAACAGALGLLARVFAYVFSLHYLIALGAAAGLSALLAVLCGTGSRRNMDRVHVWLLVLFLIAVPVLTYVTRQTSAREVLHNALQVEWNENTILRAASDALLGLSAVGLLLPMQRLLSARNAKAKSAGVWSYILCGGFLLICAGLGVYGGFVDAELTTLNAAETVLVQLGSLEVLTAPIGGVLIAVLVLTLLLFAQEALRVIGLWVAWDIVEPQCKKKIEKPLNAIADWSAVGAVGICFVLAMDSHRELTFFAQESMLLGCIVGFSLVLRACRAKTSARGMIVGMALAFALTVALLAVPTGVTVKPLGLGVIALAAMLPQGIVKEKKVDDAPVVVRRDEHAPIEVDVGQHEKDAPLVFASVEKVEAEESAETEANVVTDDDEVLPVVVVRENEAVEIEAEEGAKTE